MVFLPHSAYLHVQYFWVTVGDGHARTAEDTAGPSRPRAHTVILELLVRQTTSDSTNTRGLSVT